MLQTVEILRPYQKGNKCYVSYKVKCMKKCIYSVFICNYLACNSKTVNKKQRGSTGVKEGEKETEVEMVLSKWTQTDFTAANAVPLSSAHVFQSIPQE